MSYYNTTHLSVGDLKEAEKAAKTQEEVIIEYFQKYPLLPFSPSAVAVRLLRKGHDWPLTSVRRAFTNLTKEGVLIKTDIRVDGLYGKPEYCWRLRTKAEQQKLFV